MQKRFLGETILAVIGLLTLVPASFNEQTAAAAADPARPTDMELAQPLSPWEVKLIYSGKSWIWDGGAGYFNADPRSFAARVGEGETGWEAEGRWTISTDGVMCMRARWRSKGTETPAKACFGHRRIGKVIYQRKEPNGDWYVLRSDPPAKTDEINKIVSGDAVAGKQYTVLTPLQ